MYSYAYFARHEVVNYKRHTILAMIFAKYENYTKKEKSAPGRPFSLGKWQTPGQDKLEIDSVPV